MFWWLIHTLLITTICSGQRKEIEASLPPLREVLDPPHASQPKCLIDHMTDLQEWVDSRGYLTSAVDPYTTIDVSSVLDVTPLLTNKMSRVLNNVKLLSLARCKLNSVPAVFHIKGNSKQSLAETLEYVTFYGNRFTDISISGRQYDVTLTATGAKGMRMEYEKPVSTAWAAGFYMMKFPKLLELDLRMCSIETLSPKIFQEMPKLQALYLNENNITTISHNAFFGLNNLVHLDLSRNSFERDKAMIFHSENLFRALKTLKSLNLSFTRLTDSNVIVFSRLNNNFESISLRQTGIPKLDDFTFMNTSLKYIDVSGNLGILKNKNVLKGTENTLRIIIAENVGLNTLENFVNFSKLEILSLDNNNIFNFYPKVIKTLINLKVLELNGNRLSNWFHPIISEFSDHPLMYLSIKNNYINLITNEMLTDFSNIKYLALSGNLLVCNCNARELYELALKNERNFKVGPLMSEEDKCVNKYTKLNYKAAYNYFNDKIIKRHKINRECDDNKNLCKELKRNLTFEGDYVLIDYDQASYHCMLPSNGQAISFHEEETCHERMRWVGEDELLNQGRYELISLIILAALTLPMVMFVYVFRKNFKYCFVTMRNSTLLSLINKDDVIDDGTIFNYDVFVSYCNDDRAWVLDHLLPHVEKDCNVSVCLHERDFQVGLSILENIVSCMDRSRSIMLIISKQFLLSQWCQFEMHLAQHRLLETRREDLILVLLEEIPRRTRPTTLHYLMLTKTYIVWPKNQEEEAVFWRRLKKSLITHRLVQSGNESLA